jgi:beta-lactamase regulating signal transducer with metallopeptidase domain/lipopolysaccharide export system protein LptA
MELLIYLLKVSACTALFFAFYLLVLRNLTFFKINRFYLLLTLLLSFLIPTLNFTIEREVEATPIVYAQTEIVDEVIVNEPISAVGSIETTSIIEESFDYYSLLPYLYFGIVFSLLVIATWRILKLIKYTKGSKHELNGLKVVQKSTGFTNCSFFNYVFIDDKLSEAELQVLLKHEEVHAKQFHSIDKLILMIIKAFLWFNPVVYLYDKALEQAHEYEADEATSKNFGTEQYASLLLRLAIAKSEMPLVHNFVKSPIKDRIKMLFNSKSKNMKKLMYLLAIPIGLGLLWGFTVKVVNVATSSNVLKEKAVSKNIMPLKKHLWGKTLNGKVKSILQTEVGEILSFNYGESTIEIFNHAKGKVKVGDELMVKISGTVDDISVTDSKGNKIKKLERPCYGMSKLTNAKGVVLFDLDDAELKKQISTQLKITKQDTSKAQKDLEKKRKYEAFRKSPEFEKKLQEMKAVNGTTLTGIIGDTYESGSILIGKGKLLKVGNATYVLEGFTKGNINSSLIKNDKVVVTVDYSSFNMEVPYLIISAKTITKDGKLLYTSPPRPKAQHYAFLYEANKARYAWSKIKAFEKNSDGTIKKIVLNDKGFTINLNVADQKFKTQNFKIGDSIIVKFFGEKLIAKNTYSTDKMIVLYSWPRKYELKNKTLYDRFYNQDGSQKIKIDKPFSKKPEIGKIISLKPILTRSTSLTVDTKADISYITNGIYNINGAVLEAKESIFDKKRNTVKATKATITKNGHMIVSDEINVYANSNYFTVKEIKEPFRLNTFSKIDQAYLNIGYDKKVKYEAADSINVNKRDQIITLYGNATIANEKMKFKGSEIKYNGKLNTATIKDAIFYDEKAKVTADIMEVDFNKSKVISKKGDLRMTWN